MRLTSLTSILACACVLFAAQPASAQTDIKSIIVKHLTDLDVVAERVGVKLTDGLIGRQSA